MKNCVCFIAGVFVVFQAGAQSRDTLTNHVDSIKTELIEEVVVNAVRKLTRESVEKTIVTVKGQQIFEGDNTIAILSKIPGVVVHGDRMLYDGIEIGSVMVNNRRINFNSQKEAMDYLRNLDNKAIRNLEILNRSAAHAAAGTGKILNINLDEPFLDGMSFHPTFNYSQGYVADKGLNVRTQIKKGRFSSNIFLGYTLNKDYRDQTVTNTYKEIAEVQDQHNNQVNNNNPLYANVDIQYNLNDRSYVGVSLSHNSVDIDEDTHSKIFIYRGVDLDSESNTTNLLTTKGGYTTTSLYINTKLDSIGQNIRLEINYNIYKIIREQSLVDNMNLADPASHQRIDRKTTLPNIALDYEKKIFKDVGLSAGLLYYYMDLHEDQPSRGRVDAFQYGEDIFAQYISILGKSKYFDYQLGIRGEATKNSFNNYYNIFPSISLRKQVGPTNIQLNLNRGITRPLGFMLSPNPVYINQFTARMGDPELSPSFMDIASATLSYKNWRLATSFYNFKNQISTIQTIDSDDERLVLNQFVNIGKRTQTDLTVSYGYRAKKLSLTPMVSYSVGQFRPGDDEESIRNNFSYFNLTSSYLISKTDRIDGGFRYYFTTKTLFNTIRPRHSLDLSYNKNMLNNKLNFQLFVKDLLRKNASRFNNVMPYFESMGEEYSDSRQVGISVRYSFQTGQNVKVEGPKSNISRN